MNLYLECFLHNCLFFPFQRINYNLFWSGNIPLGSSYWFRSFLNYSPFAWLYFCEFRDSKLCAKNIIAENGTNVGYYSENWIVKKNQLMEKFTQSIFSQELLETLIHWWYIQFTMTFTCLPCPDHTVNLFPLDDLETSTQLCCHSSCSKWPSLFQPFKECQLRVSNGVYSVQIGQRCFSFDESTRTRKGPFLNCLRSDEATENSGERRHSNQVPFVQWRKSSRQNDCISSRVCSTTMRDAFILTGKSSIRFDCFPGLCN